MRLTPPRAFESALHELCKALYGLQSEQTPRARAKARREVRYRMRRLGAVLDAAFPSVAVRKAPRKPRSAYVKIRELTQRGYRATTDLVLVAAAHAAGIVPRRVQTEVGPSILLPEWVFVAGTSNVGKLRRLRKSRTAQKALLAAQRLGAT